MTNKQLEETLATLAAKAKDLRQAGVTRVAIGDIELELAEPEPPPAPPPVDERQPKSEDDGRRRSAIDDPDTFGGEIPRRRGAPRVVEHEED
jgi:hypothetical protein